LRRKAVKKFHKYIYGRHFTNLTDHRTLLSIFGSRKGISVHSANRLQRRAATLLGSDFKIGYRKSTDFGQADALSRLVSSHSTPDEEVAALEAEFHMDMLTSYLQVTFDKLRASTQKDEVLRSMKKFIKFRWLDLKYLLQQPDWSQLEVFCRRREFLTIEQGCILFRERVVIPTVLRTKVLKLFHQGHPGSQRMKSLVHNYAYCPGMDHDIGDMVHL
jgi:hypothetical protein